MAQIFQNETTKKYGFRIFYPDSNGDRKSIQKTIYKRKADAKNAAIELESRARMTDIEKAETATFANYFDEWMCTYKLGRYSVSTENKYINAQRFIEKYFHGTLLKDVTKINYQKFIDDYAKTHVKESIARINSYIKSCLAEALDDKLIERDFTRNVIISSKIESKPEELKYLELDVAAKLKKVATQNASIFNISAYEIIFALDTGARYAEVVGMTWDNVDLDNNSISIKRTYDYKSKTGFKPTKTKSSVRDIAISDSLKTMLKRLKIQQESLYLRQGFANEDKFVFMNNRHQIPTDSAANKALRKYLKEIDHDYYVSKGFTDEDADKTIKQKSKNHEYIGFHGLRHTHASYLFSQGLSLEYVSQRLGHSNVGITAKIYVHLLKDYKEREDSKAQKALQSL